MGRKTKEELEKLRDYAKILFIREGLNAKEIASKIDISQQTIGKWREEDKWDKLKITLTQTKEEQLRNLYEQLAELNAHIAAKESGKRFPDSKEADAQMKLNKSIEALERETNISEIIDSFTQFLQYLRPIDYQLAHTISFKMDEFIKSRL